MKLPRTSVLAAGATAVAASVITWAQGVFHWSDIQTTAVSGATLAGIAFLSFVVEHVRKETPSRWVGVIGTIPPFVGALIYLGVAFAWWTTTASTVTSLVTAVLTPIGALAGVTYAQSKVTSPETMAAELQTTAVTVAAAQAAGPDRAR